MTGEAAQPEPKFFQEIHQIMGGEPHGELPFAKEVGALQVSDLQFYNNLILFVIDYINIFLLIF